MSIVIRDGTGREFTVKVTDKNELSTRAAVRSRLAVRAKEGDAFIISAPIVALTTTGSFNGILYIKNTGTSPWRIWQSRLQCSVLSQWNIRTNPTTGTLISDASAATVTNCNSESTKSLSSTSYKASGDGKTVTNGTIIYNSIISAGGAQPTQPEGAFILGVGDAISWGCKPASACDVSVDVIIYIDDE